MAFEHLTTDGLLFWTMILVQSAIIVWYVEAGNPAASGMTVVATGITALMLPEQWNHLAATDIQSTGTMNWLIANSGRLLIGLVCYLVLGLVWATFRWWLHVNDAREAYDSHKRQWLEPQNLLISARLLETRAACVPDSSQRNRYRQWASACRTAAMTGGGRLSNDLKPAWRDFVENGYHY